MHLISQKQTSDQKKSGLRAEAVKPDQQPQPLLLCRLFCSPTFPSIFLVFIFSRFVCFSSSPFVVPSSALQDIQVTQHWFPVPIGRLFRAGLEIRETLGNSLTVLVGRVVIQPEGADTLARLSNAVRRPTFKKEKKKKKDLRILARRAQERGLADGALDVERLLVGLELRLGRGARVLGVALTLLSSLGTLERGKEKGRKQKSVIMVR